MSEPPAARRLELDELAEPFTLLPDEAALLRTSRVLVIWAIHGFSSLSQRQALS